MVVVVMELARLIMRNLVNLKAEGMRLYNGTILERLENHIDSKSLSDSS